VERAHKLGAIAPEHYLIPRRIAGKQHDPTIPPSRWAVAVRGAAPRRSTGSRDWEPKISGNTRSLSFASPNRDRRRSAERRTGGL
jgi:hypothetical protein